MSDETQYSESARAEFALWRFLTEQRADTHKRIWMLEPLLSDIPSTHYILSNNSSYSVSRVKKFVADLRDAGVVEVEEGVGEPSTIRIRSDFEPLVEDVVDRVRAAEVARAEDA